MTRHALLAWVVGLVLLGASGARAQASVEAGAATAPCPTPATAHWQAVVPGVWIRPGVAQEIAPDNRGRVASQVLIGNGASATLIDPGPSLEQGQAARWAARCELGLTITRVLDSHAHAENVLGNAAFADLALEATPATAAAMRARCPQCLAAITQAAGASALAGTGITLPAPTLRAGQILPSDSGAWQLLEFTGAHSQSDLALWNASQRLLIAPGLVYAQRLPELAQGSLVGWIAALRQLRALDPDWVLGQRATRGPAGDLPATERYLCELAQGVWQAMEQGRTASDASHAAATGLPTYAGWAGHAERQSFNVQRAWRELEPLWIRGGPSPCPATD